jgi:hypothetical protein
VTPEKADLKRSISGSCSSVSFNLDRNLEFHIAEATVVALDANSIDPG